MFGAGQACPGSQVLTAPCVEGCGEVWGCWDARQSDGEAHHYSFICDISSVKGILKGQEGRWR